jgi:hypothetical protein
MKNAFAVAVCAVFPLLASCGEPEPASPTATPVPPTLAPIQATSTPLPLSGVQLVLTSDVGSCVYKGPTPIKAGQPVTLVLHNESAEPASMALMRHFGTETIQNMIDYLGEESLPKHAPTWVVHVNGVWKHLGAGASHTWEGTLQPKIHTLASATREPHGAWFGVGSLLRSDRNDLARGLLEPGWPDSGQTCGPVCVEDLWCEVRE